MKKNVLAAAIMLLVFCTGAFGRDYTRRVFHASNGADLSYKVIYPDGFDPSETYPLFLFLHGSGERGSDNESQTVHGGRLFASDPLLAKAIVVVPQCPREDYWVMIDRPVQNNATRTFPASAPMSVSLGAVKELLDCMVGLGFVDTDRIYGSGLSMGGFAILDLVARFPDLFAAVEPICGGINVERMRSYEGGTAFRFFHGLRDDIVLPKFSREACAALVANGKEASIIEYPEANHNSWDSAFAEPDFISWLFSHSR